MFAPTPIPASAWPFPSKARHRSPGPFPRSPRTRWRRPTRRLSPIRLSGSSAYPPDPGYPPDTGLPRSGPSSGPRPGDALGVFAAAGKGAAAVFTGSFGPPAQAIPPDPAASAAPWPMSRPPRTSRRGPSGRPGPSSHRRRLSRPLRMSPPGSSSRRGRRARLLCTSRRGYTGLAGFRSRFPSMSLPGLTSRSRCMIRPGIRAAAGLRAPRGARAGLGLRAARAAPGRPRRPRRTCRPPFSAGGGSSQAQEAELRRIRSWLSELLPSGPAREDVVTVATELAANAVRTPRAARTASSPWNSPGRCSP